MRSPRSIIGVLLLALPVAMGCAPAYHWYDECRVPCKYRSPCPLPYEGYGGCPCHSCAVVPYLTGVQPELINPAYVSGVAEDNMPR